MARNSTMWTPIDYSFSVAAEVYLRNLMREKNGTQAAKTYGASPVKKAPVKLVEREVSDGEDDGVDNVRMGKKRSTQ